ncbi:hypothetical protein FOL47_011251 [Perkinsus chesapeaki]|uniref:Uncharacterized protein n=1 Tax=Perkinsus chesapeaki TaxID=330153 RepID=A0A7J6MNS6_PERCH|nr:hypothetical protein FOL47_011251 [Perkinsus chesapeaki]
MDKGAKRFILAGYSIIDSKIIQDPPFSPPWDKTDFANLKKKVSDAGGLIWLQFERIYGKGKFDESLFRESARQFIQNYSVDGFLFDLQKPEVAKDAYRILSTVKALGKTAVLQYWPEAEKAVKKTGLGALADYTVVYLTPYFDKSLTKVFNTDKFAINRVGSAIKAGANAKAIILRIPLLARADYESSDSGYSSAIFDMHGDPKGSGSIIFPKGKGYYFFSQPRAVEKVILVKKMGLHGIMIDPPYSETTDIYPWDDRSIFYALAQSVKS